MSHQIDLALWHKHVSTHSIKIYGGAEIPLCPSCTGGNHEICRFQSGSLYCVTHNCANPHHRSQA